MILTQDEIALIRTLALSTKGLHIYTIFRKAGLAAPAMSKALGNLQRSNIIDVGDEVAALTEKGKKLVAMQPSLLLAQAARLQKRLNQSELSPRAADFRGPTIGINEFYVPRTSELPRSLLDAVAKLSKQQ